jgi:hypothetical protein
LADPALRKALDLSRSNAGSIRWISADAEIASIQFVWLHLSRHLIVTAAINGVVRKQTIAICTSAPHFGGSRPWFRCPTTGRRARVLLMAPGAVAWVSRIASGLGYASQRMGVAERRLKRLVEGVDYGRRRNAMRRFLRRARRTR